MAVKIKVIVETIDINEPRLLTEQEKSNLRHKLTRLIRIDPLIIRLLNNSVRDAYKEIEDENKDMNAIITLLGNKGEKK